MTINLGPGVSHGDKKGTTQIASAGGPASQTPRPSSLTFGSSNHDTRSLLSPLILLNEWSRKGANGPGTGTSGALGCRQEVVCNQLAICQLDSPPSHAPILL